MFGCGGIECVFHIITRSRYAVRWDLENGVGSCFKANYLNEMNPHPYIDWFIKNRGLEAYENLVRRSKRIAKYSNSDLLEIKESLEKKLEALSGNNNLLH